MMPIHFKEVNIMLKRPDNYKETECADLPSFCEDDEEHNTKHWISCWVFTPDDIENIKTSGKVWLHLNSNVHPPVVLDTFNPFLEKKDGN